jgi:hypothetical protein
MLLVQPKNAQDTLKRIEAWQGWYDIERIASKEYGMTTTMFQEALPEYQKFMTLVALGYPVGMFSRQIDMLWHSHLLHTALYRTFCETAIGRFVDHQPTLSPSPEAKQCEAPPTPPPSDCIPPIPDTGRYPGKPAYTVSEFFAAYVSTFGSYPPHIWGLSVADGVALIS